MVVILTVGLPASGKSTWAKQYVRNNSGAIRFNNDEFSYMTTGWDDGRSFEPMDPDYLRMMRKMAIAHAVNNDVDIVLDNTNLSPSPMNEVSKFVSADDIELVYFKVDYLTCIERNMKRGEPVPNNVITKMAKFYSDIYPWIDYG